MRLSLQAPKLPLTDGTIRLRMPCEQDVAALAEYAVSPGGSRESGYLSSQVLRVNS